MATYQFFLDLEVDISKASSGQVLLNKQWLDEANAAMGAIRAGALRAYKDLAEPRVFGIVRVEAENPLAAHGTLLDTVLSLPMGKAGQLKIREIRQVVDYTEWYEYLRSRK